MAGPNGSIQGPAEAKWGYTTLSVADWDGDGLPDIVVNSIWGRVEWLRNVGTRTAAAAGRAAADRGRVDGRAAEARVDLVDAAGQGTRHAVAHHAGRVRLQRRRPGRPGDARPRRLPRPLRADRARRQAACCCRRGGRSVDEAGRAAAPERQARPAAAAAASCASPTGTATASSTCCSTRPTPICYRGSRPARRHVAFRRTPARSPSRTSKATTSARRRSISTATACPTSSAAPRTAASTSCNPRINNGICRSRR